ncbi:MAG: hypothetical protein E7504_03045 [Ruminococcus sp.]|nr:hypothetical protein [Ruminococcus sp.]
MTAKSLLNGLPARNMRSAIKQNSKLMIVIGILQALGIPVMVGAGMLELWQESLGYFYYYERIGALEMYAVIGGIVFALAVIMGIVAGISVFHELWKKHDVDMMYALPLTGTQRFFSHYLAGAVIYLLPYVAAVIIGWIILLGGSFAIDFSSGILDVTRMEFLGEACKYYLLASLGMFLLMWLYYTTTALITVCCGTVFESAYATFLLNCLVPGTFAAVLAVICNNVGTLNFEYLWQPIGYTSPIGGLIYLFYILSESETSFSYYNIMGSQATDHGLIPAFIRWALIITILIVISLIVAWKLYQRRKAESVSKPFVYLGAYYFMLTVLTVLILCLVETDSNSLGPILIFSAVIYFLMEVIRKRGFRKFWMSLISYVLTVALTLGIFTLVINTDAFGTVYRIPALGSISSVKVEIGCIAGEHMGLEYTDTDVIRAIREVHKDIADDMKKHHNTTKEINSKIRELDFRILGYGDEMSRLPYENYEKFDSNINPSNQYSYYTYDPETEQSYNYSYYDEDGIEHREYNYAREFSLTLTYYTHMGTTMNRYYYINMDQYKDLLEILYGTQLYVDAAAEYTRSMLKQDMMEYDEDLGETVFPQYMHMTLESFTGIQPQAVLVSGGEATIDRIADCYYNDLKKMKNGEQMTSGIYGVFCHVPIWNACTETIALLESLGFRSFTVEEKFSYTEGDSMLHMRLYAPGDYACGAEINKTAITSNSECYVRENSAAYEDIYYHVKDMDMEEYFPEIHAMLEAAQSHYISEEACYMLSVNGVWYAIPSDKSELAEAVINLPEGHIESVLGDYYKKVYANN